MREDTGPEVESIRAMSCGTTPSHVDTDTTSRPANGAEHTCQTVNLMNSVRLWGKSGILATILNASQLRSHKAHPLVFVHTNLLRSLETQCVAFRAGTRA
jgi:hypothetical protein